MSSGPGDGGRHESSPPESGGAGAGATGVVSGNQRARSAVMLFNVRGFAPVRRRPGCPSGPLPPDFWLLPWAMPDEKPRTLNRMTALPIRVAAKFGLLAARPIVAADGGPQGVRRFLLQTHHRLGHHAQGKVVLIPCGAPIGEIARIGIPLPGVYRVAQICFSIPVGFIGLPG